MFGDYFTTSGPLIPGGTPGIDKPLIPGTAGLLGWLKVAAVGALVLGVLWVLRPLFQLAAGVSD